MVKVEDEVVENERDDAGEKKEKPKFTGNY